MATILAFCLFFLHTAIGWQSPNEYRVSMKVGLHFRRSQVDDACSICFAPDVCIEVDKGRCDYYIETVNLIQEDDEAIAVESDRDPLLRSKVDFLMRGLVDKGLQTNKECVPLISRYTDCTKENICLGCTTCVCDDLGRWNCTGTQKCRPNSMPITVDHHTLLVVIQNLNKAPDPVRRNKRSIYPGMALSKITQWLNGAPVFEGLNVPETVVKTIHDSQSEEKGNFVETNQLGDHKGHSDEILKYVVHSLVNDVIRETEKEVINGNRAKRWIKRDKERKTYSLQELVDWFVIMNQGPTPQHHTTELPIGITEPEFLTFDEVLDAEQKNNRRRKPPLDLDTEKFGESFTDMDDDNNVGELGAIDDIKEVVTESPAVTESVVDENAVTESLMEQFTEVIIDLLQSRNAMKGELFEKEKEHPQKQVTKAPENFVESLNVIEEVKEPAILVKREAAVTTNNIHPTSINTTGLPSSATSVTESNLPTTSTPIVSNRANENENATIKNLNVTTLKSNVTHSSINRLVDKVVYPLSDVYTGVLKEIHELHKINQELLNFVAYYVDVDGKPDNRTVLDKNVLSMYKADTLRQQSTKNISSLERYASKLRRDVYEVIKDVVGIQKLYSGPSKIPDDLKFLVKAMKHYVHKQGFHSSRRKGNQKSEPALKERKSSRRNMPQTTELKNVKDYIIEIFQLIDKDMPIKNALEVLSRPVRKVLYRIVKENFIDEFAQIGLRVYDPHYNLTNDLSNVGFKWGKMTAEAARASVTNQLYMLKQLHLVLSVDISKLNDALTLINFAHSRRMVPVDEHAGSRIMLKLDDQLKFLSEQVIFMIQKLMLKKKKYSSLQAQVKDTQNRNSFLKQVKSFLMNSKKDIMELLHRNTPKSDIVKKIAGQRLDDMGRKRLSELQNTMKKWQTHLNIIPNRYKRSPQNFGNMRNRMKNIIPKYLRGKLHPALSKQREDKKNKKGKTKTTKSWKTTKATKKPKTRSSSKKSVKKQTKSQTKQKKKVTKSLTTKSLSTKSLTKSTHSLTTTHPSTRLAHKSDVTTQGSSTV